MMQIPEPSEIECRAKACGFSIKTLCKLSGTANSTFYRWRSGIHQPNTRTIHRWLETLELAEQDKRPAA